MKDAIENLAAAIRKTAVAEEFYSNREAFEQDDEATDLMTRLNTLTYELSWRYQKGKLAKGELDQYNEVQNQFRKNEKVAALEQSENRFQLLLRECNRAISTEINMDFAAQAAPADCDCK